MNYDPANYDVLFLLFGSRQALDSNAINAAVRSALEPWYAFPFPAAGAVDMPQWDEDANAGYFTARAGLLATDLGGGIGKYPFNDAWPVVTGIRWVLQVRNPATVSVARRSAQNALRTALDGVMRSVPAAHGNIEVAVLAPYAERATGQAWATLHKLPFPSTPTLPGDEATYKSGAIFAVLAGVALGGVLISAALKKD